MVNSKVLDFKPIISFMEGILRLVFESCMFQPWFRSMPTMSRNLNLKVKKFTVDIHVFDGFDDPGITILPWIGFLDPFPWLEESF